MGTYIVNTKEEQKKMLSEIGCQSMDDLFRTIPKEARVKELHLPSGMSELEVASKVENMAEKNKVFSHIFRGAGVYNHYIPAIVKSVVSKEEFLTSYTPYQAEISQGILQSIFEYQTMICELTDMEVANASLYDGASAAAEATEMCIERKKKKILIAGTLDPKVADVIKTYSYGKNYPVEIIPQKDKFTDMEALEKMLDENSACVVIQQPNFFGGIEDVEKITALVHEKKAKVIVSCNPISLLLLQTPGECGADIAVGEGQPLGLEMGFGGPYLGFMATTKKMIRKLPGRIVGETVDRNGKKAYVLTLQAREQHIRREKAGSNVCTNQNLCSLTASVYLTAMGPQGLREVAVQCVSKAAYLRKVLEEAGLSIANPNRVFHEFVTESKVSSHLILKALEEKGILGGLALNDQEILWCATEKNTKEEMDMVAEIVKEVVL